MPRRTIAILGGTGRQGRGIARRLAAAGFPIVVGSRDPARAAATVREWGADSIGVASYGDAIAGSDVVILALPFDAVVETLDAERGRFGAAFVIDVTVPVAFTSGNATLVHIPDGSAAELVRSHTPPSVGVAAAFKTVPAHALDEVERPLECDEFVCGDSPDARSVATELVEAVRGLRAIDVGPLPRARSIEHLTLLAIGINRRHKIHDARFRVVGL